MIYPIYETTQSPKKYVKGFLGINRKKKGGNGECVDCLNVDGDEFPVLRSVKKPRLITNSEKDITRLTAPAEDSFKLCGIVGSDIVGFGSFYGRGDDERKNDILKCADALITVPSFNVYNLNTKKITERDTADYLYYKSNDYSKYTYITKEGKKYVLKNGFNAGKDNSRITYIIVSTNGHTYTYEPEEDSYIIALNGGLYYYKKNEDGEYYEAENAFLEKYVDTPIYGIIVVSEYEDMDIACVFQNRVWGCSKDGKRIRCSKQGELNNFLDFNSGAASSWSCEIGSDGRFFGIIPFGNAIFAFKETCVHVIYGTAPSNFSIEKTFDGCGCIDKNSLVSAGNSLFWLGYGGIYRYSGGTPKAISENLNRKYKSCVSFTDHKKVYFKLLDFNGNSEFLSFDIKNELWHRYDGKEYIGGFLYGGNMYAYTKNAVFELENGDFGDWAFESVLEYDDNFSDCSMVSFYIRAELRSGSSIKIELRGISQSDWETLGGYSTEKDEMIKEKFVARLKNDKAFWWRISGNGEAYIYEIEMTVPSGGKSFKKD